ncbi:MAG: M15 family metallopeptidase [Natronospirillum sp.]|uniref:M15 family metallopeptidase n=1 Tax=Natronospirillum sp. TaxID=2812955 RepID=UPI0025DFCC1A|nr:M15 family metallopeptidase [Natronospirillum sp.]MCH8552712.1 M15 family metallopeptidase [Natronospirillum sp.]
MFVAGASVASGSYLWQHRHGLEAAPLTVDQELSMMPERHMTRAEVAESMHLEIARDEAGMSLEELLRSTKPDMDLQHLERLADELRHQRRIEEHQEVTARAAEDAYMDSDDELDEGYLARVRDPDADHPEDVIMVGDDWDTLLATSRRIEAVREYVGFGNFNILPWDDMLAFARNVSEIGRFQPRELEFMESLFHADARNLGFYGERTSNDITTRVDRNNVVKVPRSGHFLWRGESLDLFNRLTGDIGDTLILTSGVRSIPKQFDLFLARAKRTEGNLSRASRSLAPPGYSYHATGDFDVGKYGLGLGNFSEEFANTNVFRELQSLGYTNIRYTVDNRFGVRFEPWHIRVA